MRKSLLLLGIAFILSSCGINQKVSVYESHPPKTNTQIVHTGQPLPQNVRRIGSITVGDTGLTFTSLCTYEACMQTVITEAGKAGADVAYIVRIKEPTEDIGGSSCYTITADLYVYQ